jgi:hypothetical protein
MRLTHVVLVAVLVPATATADVLLTPFVGRSAASSGMDTATHVGVALGWTSASGIGVEGEFSNISKPFPAPLGDGGGNFVRTVMGNLVFGRRVGPLVPYVAGGLGLLTINYGTFINDPRHNVAFNAGGGVRVGSGRLSVRADLRYFRTLTEQENVFFPTNPPAFDYWRTAIGVTLGF